MKWIYTIVPMGLGYFFLRFGMVSRGRKNEIIQFVGGLVCFSTVILAWFLLGWKAWLGFIAVFFFVLTPIVESSISKIEHKINEPYS